MHHNSENSTWDPWIIKNGQLNTYLSKSMEIHHNTKSEKSENYMYLDPWYPS